MIGLDQALDRGDGAAAWRLAGLLHRGTLSLDYALALLLLATDDPDRYECGMARWLQRWDAERPAMSPAQRRRLAAALDGLPGLEGITELTGTLELPRTAATLVHLYPTVPR